MRRTYKKLLVYVVLAVLEAEFIEFSSYYDK